MQRRTSILTQKNTRMQRCLNALQPFYALFGVLFFLVSLLVVISILLTSIDRVRMLGHNRNAGS